MLSPLGLYSRHRCDRFSIRFYRQPLRVSVRPRTRNRARTMRATVLPSLLLALFATGSSAQTFREAVQLARTSEPVYLGVKANAVAAQERSKQAFAGLLPQVNAEASTNANRRDYQTRGSAIPDSIDHYNSNSAQLRLTQPIYRPSNNIALRQAESAVSQADYQLVAAEQELLAKLVSSWFDAMFARDSVLFSTRQASATRQQWEILRRGVDLGTASEPAAEEARAKHEQALAERTSAEMEYEVKAAGLEQIIGPMRSFAPPYLSNSSKTQDLSAESLDRWLDWLSRCQSCTSQAARPVRADARPRRQLRQELAAGRQFSRPERLRHLHRHDRAAAQHSPVRRRRPRSQGFRSDRAARESAPGPGRRAALQPPCGETSLVRLARRQCAA